MDGQGSPRLSLNLLVLILPALWNGFVSALAIFNRRLPRHREINIGLDVIFGMGLFVTSGGLGGPLPWVALLPLFSGAIYFETTGVVVVTAVMTLAQVGVQLLISSGQAALFLLGMMAAGNLTGAVVIGLLSRPIVQRLRTTYQNTIEKREEGARHAQRQEHDRMRVLFEMIETFSSTLNYQTVLETSLETAIKALEDLSGDADGMVGAVMLYGKDGRLEITASRRFAARDMAVQLPGDEGALNAAFRDGEAVLVEDLVADPELSQLATMQSQKIGLCLPLIRGMNAYGVMLFGHSAEDFFNQERVETLQMLGNQAVIALQNARLYQDLAHEKERIIQSQEEAQKKLARDLHDGPTQSVAAIAMRIEIARRLMERSTREAAQELIKVEELARRTTQEIRHMLFTLRPLVLEAEGLEAALRTIAEKMNDLYNQCVRIEVDRALASALDATKQTVIFSLAEEAVNNARKHAQSSEIVVRLRLVPKINDVAMLEISDNGVGFDVQSVMNDYDRRGSLGMVNLRERAEQIDALLKIESAPGSGTRVRVFIPLTPGAAERMQHRR